ncbi:MAG: VanZ family protein [Bacteroidales bacterium]|nr:VanZ family protein [Bacteroidales bacterium]
MGIKILRYTPTILWFTGILVASFISSSHISPKLYLFPHQDKVIHACMYLGLAFLFLCNSRHFFPLTLKFIVISVVVICIISGTIEILQPILSNRSNDMFDLVANSTGAILAGGIVYGARRKLGKEF